MIKSPAPHEVKRFDEPFEVLVWLDVAGIEHERSFNPVLLSKGVRIEIGGRFDGDAKDGSVQTRPGKSAPHELCRFQELPVATWFRLPPDKLRPYPDRVVQAVS